MWALTELVLCETSLPGLRVRDEYVRSAHVGALVAVHFVADLALRAVGFTVVSYALGDQLASGLLLALLGLFALRLGRVSYSAGLHAAAAVLRDGHRLLETLLRAVLPVVAPTVLQPQTAAQRRFEWLASSIGPSALLGLGLGFGPPVPRPLTEPTLRADALALAACALGAKYLAFAYAVLPATEASYGVAGVGVATRELGRAAILRRGEPGVLPHPAGLPPHSTCGAAQAARGLASRACDGAAQAVHYLLVVLTLGVCGRRADGSYYEPQQLPEEAYEELLSA